MKLRLSIGTKIGLGFFILIVCILISSYFTYSSLNDSKKINDQISNVWQPTNDTLKEFELLVTKSKMLISSWIFIQSGNDVPDKVELRKIHKKEYPALRQKLINLSELWKENEKKELDTLLITVDSLLYKVQDTVMKALSTFDSYDNSFMLFIDIHPLMEQDGAIVVLTSKALDEIYKLSKLNQDSMRMGQEKMRNSLARFREFIIFIGLLMFIGGIIIAVITVNSIRKPIKYLRNILLMMGTGKLPDKIEKFSKDEIEEMSEALQMLLEGLKNKTLFAEKIGNGQFDAEYIPLSLDDVLGNSLLTMRKNLQIAADKDRKRQAEDEKVKWASMGYAEFSELLRTDSGNIEDFSFAIIRKLVKYLNINQGGIFLLNDSDPDDIFLELKACFAYDRKKFLKRKIKPGETLVGNCYREGESIFITDIPNDYSFITSGLGGATPKSVLLVPVRTVDKVFGVIEIASFHEFEKHEIEFAEKICENIGATLSTIKTNERTHKLLAQTTTQAEELSAQEEELRQNLEELQATQEESSRRIEDYEKTIEELKTELNRYIRKPFAEG